MSWGKREAVTNLVILGDASENRKKVGGLLIDCPFDRMYPDKMNYVLVQQNGEEIVLSGSASLGRQLTPDDIGKFVKCEFSGWGKSGNGKYKIIEVHVWEGEASDVMKKWPKYGTITAPKPERKTTKPPHSQPEPPDEFEKFPGALAGDDEDDLPF